MKRKTSSNNILLGKRPRTLQINPTHLVVMRWKRLDKLSYLQKIQPFMQSWNSR
jgi:hypothetical protein